MKMWLLIAAVACILPGSLARAQTVNLGDDVSRPIPGVGHDYVQGLSETVNPANGNVHVHIELPVPKGRGFTLPFAITYDSGELYHVTTRTLGNALFGPPLYNGTNNPTDRSQAGNGWGNTVPYVTAQGFAVGVPMAPYYGNNDWQCPMSGSYNFYDPNGGSHMLGLAAIGVGVMMQTAPQPSQACNGLTYNGFGYAYSTLGGDDQVYAQMDAACNGNYQNVAYPTDCTNAAPAFTVTDQSGTVYSFPANNVTGGLGGQPQIGPPSMMYPAQIEDRNGNIINFTANGSTYGLPITDSLGRPLVSSGCAGAYCSSPTSYTVGGLTYTLNYGNIENANFSVGNVQIGSQTGCGFQNSVSYTNRQVLTGITLPNGQSYSFGYDGTYGLLNNITYPNGGWVHYTWNLSTAYSTLASFYSSYDAGGLCNFKYQTPVIVQRQVGYGTGSTAAQTQTFANLFTNTNWVGSTALWSTKNAAVTTTDNVTGNVLVTKYTYGYVNQPYQPNSSGQIVPQLPVENTIQYLDGNNALLKAVTKTWADQFTMTSETTTLPNMPSYGAAYIQAATFPGVPLAKYEYDFGNVPSTMPPPTSSPGNATRTTVYGYYNINLPCHFTAPITYQTNPVPCPSHPAPASAPAVAQIITYAGGATYNGNTNTWAGTRIAETDVYYDGQTSFGGPPTATGNSVSVPSGTHDETNYAASSTTARGNPTTIIKWLNTGSSPTTTYTYDETGQVVSKLDACGNPACSDMTGSNHTTAYSYADNPPGGNSAGNSNAYVTTITYPTPADGVGQQEHFSYNYPTGQLTSSTDVNTQVTRYIYNTPPTGCSFPDDLDRLSEIDYPDTGKTTYCYNDASPSVTTTRAITSGSNEVSTVVFDGMGHEVQSVLSSDPDGATTVDTQYNGIGLVYTRSNPHRTAGSSTDGTTTNRYDALGRIIAITRPDGSDVDTSYSGNCETVLDEAGSVRRSCSDALGRLIEVDEPGTGGQNEVAGSGTATIGSNTNGEQSVLVAATKSRGDFTIMGNPPPSLCGTGPQGTITISVNGSQVGSAPYYTTSSTGSVATALWSSINSSLVTADNPNGGPTVTVWSKATGSSTNYAVSAQPGAPTGQCKTMFVTGPANLSGGQDAHTAYDSGSVFITVNGVSSGVDYGSSDSTASIASNLAAAVNRNTSSVTASPNGSGVMLTANDAGASSNYSVSTPAPIWNTSLFSQPSFTVSAPNSLTNGTDSTLGTGPLVTLYIYDALNNLTCAVQKGSDTTPFTSCAASPATWRPRSFGYDSLSRLTSATNPESGTILYVYDANSNVNTKTAPAPNQTGSATVTTSHHYDVLNRLVATNYSDGTTPANYYSYDVPPSWAPSVTYVVGRIANSSNQYGGSSSSQATATLYSYDRMGRITGKWEQTPSMSPGGKFIYSTFDLAGNLTSTTTAAGTVISYGPYNGANRLTTITSSLNDAQHPQTLYSVDPSLGYYPNGALRKASFGNGLTQALAFNNRLQPCRINVNSGGGYFSTCTDSVPSGNVLDFTMGYNAGRSDNGNVASWSAVGNQTFSRSYGYDSLNRIQSMTDTASGQACKGLSWTVDAWSNMTAQTNTGGTCYTFQVAAGTNNQMTGNQYDAAGNVTYGPGSHHFTYDAENRIIQVDSGAASYVYNENGERVRKNTGSTWTEYFYGPNGSVQSEYNGSWPFQFVYAGNDLIAQYTSSTTEFVHKDHLGSTRFLTGVNQGIVDSMDYLPFGLQIAGGTTTTHKFTGKERDNESGLDNFGARYYESYIGRFMTPDPGNVSAIFHMKDPQSWNSYAYARNNPLKYTDPSGLDYTICDSDGKNCSHMDDATFDSERNKDKGELFQNGSMFHFDKDGNKVMDGTYQWNGPDIPGDSAANLEAMEMIGNGGTAFVGAFAKSMVYTAAGGVVVGEVVEGVQAAAQVAKLSMLKPLVSNPQLAAIVEKLFQATDVLEGGTAGAVRYEGLTGNLLSSAGHAQKAEQAITEITNVMKSGNLSYSEQQVARELIGDLTRALSGK